MVALKASQSPRDGIAVEKTASPDLVVVVM